MALLQPYREFFEARGLSLPMQSHAAQVDYEKLVSILMSPHDPAARAPQPLIDTLYVLDEVASHEGMDALITAALDEHIPLACGENDTPIDVVLQVWLANPEVVHTQHAEQNLHHPRSFEYFPRTRGPVPEFKFPKGPVLRAVEKNLDSWFEEHRRGRGTRVFMFAREANAWFLVRHGQPLRREGSIEGVKSSSVLYRPECFDVVIYDHALGELRIHANSKRERTLYRESFGQHLFGNKDLFGTGDKYTLDPLRVNGAKSLECEDIEGIDHITLREIHFFWGGAQGEVEIRKAADVFAAYAARDRQMPSTPKISKATFDVLFTDSRKPRKVAVSVPNRTNCVRDDDSTLIDQWLQARKFIASDSAEADGEEVEEVLVAH